MRLIIRLSAAAAAMLAACRDTTDPLGRVDVAGSWHTGRVLAPAGAESERLVLGVDGSYRAEWQIVVAAPDQSAGELTASATTYGHYSLAGDRLLVGELTRVGDVLTVREIRPAESSAPSRTIAYRLER